MTWPVIEARDAQPWCLRPALQPGLVPEEDPRRAAIADQVEALLLRRGEARAAKDWPQADAIRDELVALGVVVTDTASGPQWDLA